MSVVGTIYEEATGAYVQYIKAPDIENLLLNLGPGQVMVAGEQPEESYLRNGAVQIMPPRPQGRHWQFDPVSEQWIDPRTAADMQAALYAARAATSLDKSELLTRMFLAGIFDEENALIASRGEIPPALEVSLENMPPEARVIARIKWRSDNVISRVNPVIVLAAQALGVTDQQMDEIFSVRVPE